MRLASLLLLALFPATASAGGFAVVELFTSEGCSSCPPADRLLADLAKRPNVYALEFHVDYWNSLGWRDPYSAAAYSDRQRAYGDKLGEDQVYTPQMIVNGTNAFVGSNRQRAEDAIAAALATRPKIEFNTELVHGSQLYYRVSGKPKNAWIYLAILDAARTSKVTRGENQGLTLTHVRIVRAITSAKLVDPTFGSLEVPGSIPAGGTAFAWIQEGEVGPILSARELHF